MTVIDDKQDRDIVDLQNIDKLHTKDLDWLKSGFKFVIGAFGLWVVTSTATIFVLLEIISKLSK